MSRKRISNDSQTNPFGITQTLTERELAAGVSRLRKAISAERQARNDLEAARAEVGPEAVAAVEGMEIARKKFDEAAAANARNVTQVRVAQFLDAHPQVKGMLSGFFFMRGLTEFDVEACWAAMRGDPRPIPAVTDEDEEFDAEEFFSASERAEMAEADAEIDAEYGDEEGE